METVANVLITGANSGIGLELVRLFLQRGDRVIAVCRRRSAELAASDARIIEAIDFREDSAFPALRTAVGDEKLDILINNAGVLIRDSLEEIQPDDILRQFRINALAPLRVSLALLDKIVPGGKILMTTSRMGSIGDNDSGGYYGYRASKAALNMLGVSLANDLRERNIAVGLVHPGYVKTRMTGYTGYISPLESARGYLKIVAGLNPGNSGGFWHVNGEELPW